MGGRQRTDGTTPLRHGRMVPRAGQSRSRGPRRELPGAGAFGWRRGRDASGMPGVGVTARISSGMRGTSRARGVGKVSGGSRWQSFRGDLGRRGLGSAGCWGDGAHPPRRRRPRRVQGHRDGGALGLDDRNSPRGHGMGDAGHGPVPYEPERQGDLLQRGGGLPVARSPQSIRTVGFEFVAPRGPAHRIGTSRSEAPHGEERGQGRDRSPCCNEGLRGTEHGGRCSCEGTRRRTLRVGGAFHGRSYGTPGASPILDRVPFCLNGSMEGNDTGPAAWNTMRAHSPGHHRWMS